MLLYHICELIGQDMSVSLLVQDTTVQHFIVQNPTVQIQCRTISATEHI